MYFVCILLSVKEHVSWLCKRDKCKELKKQLIMFKTIIRLNDISPTIIRTLEIVCALSQRYTNDSVLGLAQIKLYVMILEHFLLGNFCQTKHFFRWSDKQVDDTSIVLNSPQLPVRVVWERQ